MGIHYIENNELKKITDAIKEKNRIETFNGADMAQEIKRNPLLNKIITNDASAHYSISADELEGCGSLIRTYAFYGCVGLTSIVFPETVLKINKNVFNGCSDLYSIEFKGNLDFIGENAFRSCNKLQKLILRGNKVPSFQSVGANPIMDAEYLSSFDPTLAGIYVPSEMIEKYNADTIWKNFFMLIKPLEQADEELDTW